MIAQWQILAKYAPQRPVLSGGNVQNMTIS